MRKDYKKFLGNLKPIEPPIGLFDKIILAIKKEQEIGQTRKLIFSFLSLLLISLISTPVSAVTFINQIKNSGISYFIFAAASDLKTFFVLWQDFGLAILESFPIFGLMVFLLSLAISVFTIRLFLYKKRLLLGYLSQNFA